jgi:hypothetical protein
MNYQIIMGNGLRPGKSSQPLAGNFPVVVEKNLTKVYIKYRLLI